MKSQSFNKKTRPHSNSRGGFSMCSIKGLKKLAYFGKDFKMNQKIFYWENPYKFYSMAKFLSRLNRHSLITEGENAEHRCHITQFYALIETSSGQYIKAQVELTRQEATKRNKNLRDTGYAWNRTEAPLRLLNSKTQK